jgi:hypothetical protein
MITKEDLEKARLFWQKKGVLRTANINGTRVKWYSSPQAINPDLPDYAWLLSDGKEAVIAISDSLPLDFQPFWAYHELIETTQEIGEGRCARTLEKEIGFVPENIRKEYIQRRKVFFKNLLKYSRNNDLPPETIEEFERSLAYLENLTGDTMTFLNLPFLRARREIK